MALVMKLGRAAVRFEWSDGEVESTVTVAFKDDQEVLVRKLKRVIALVEGSAQALQQWVAEQAPTAVPLGTEYKAAKAAVLEPPVLPVRLKGSVELEGAEPQPGNGWAGLGGEG
jgi:hypothetical protein